MELNLKDKVALVTGGSRGLGRAICLALAAEGARVAVNYAQSAEKAGAVAAEIQRTHGVDAMVVGADVGIEAQVHQMFDAVERTLGTVRVLINNAAFCPSGPITKYTEEEWSRTLRTNMTGPFLCCRRFVSRLLDQGQTGRIVNLVSQAAFRGSTSGHLPYDSSKGGLVSFTIALALELAPKGIAVNAVAPGMVRTEMVAEVLARNEARYLDRIPLRRIATPEEIAKVVAFLASDGASYMTGATVDVSGGMLMR